jgi:DNA repair exonuclease SbcCD ATPase subunit
MLVFKKLTIKNFMSVGEMPQTLDFDTNGLTLILGENLDMSADSQTVARNGAGKSAIFNALSFAMFGQALSNIRRDNLINNINEKGMFVIFEFDKDGHSYKIERGRKPNFFRFKVDNTEINAPDTDESQGESKHTQEELEKVLGMSHNLFKHIIALNTVTDPFLKLGAKQQREFIEELLGMKMLSEKAEALKELLRVTKEEIKLEDVKIKTQQDSNKKIEKNIVDLKARSERWEIDHVEKIQSLEKMLDDLSHIDASLEIENHKILSQIISFSNTKNRLLKENKSTQNEMNRINGFLEKSTASLERAMQNNCPTCGHEIHDEKHEHILNDLAQVIESDTQKIDSLTVKVKENETQIADLDAKLQELGAEPEVFYESVEDAYNHKSDMELCAKELQMEVAQTNPYKEQVETLEKSGIQEIDFENMNDLVKVRDHQEFLLKLLTSNDSFIRKKIVDQNIAFLNDRLRKYLEKLGLPHSVIFQSDLTVQITNFGRELDFESLSRGEKTRLILGLSWSFRDIFELLIQPVSVVLIDELLDVGADQQLVESAVGIIRKMNQERNKSIFLISHKDELVSKIPTVLKVVKDGGFSAFELVNDYTS